MYKITEIDGEKFAEVEMTVKIEIFLGESDEIPTDEDIDFPFIEERFDAMERSELGDAILEQIDLEQTLIKTK